jgi:hypothetical protein
MARELLNRDDVRAALRLEGPPRPPLANSLWHNADTVRGRENEWAAILAAYPDDCVLSGMGVDYWQAPPDAPTYRWAFGDKVKPEGLPVDACPVIADWRELDAFLAEFPSPHHPVAADHVRRLRAQFPDRYLLVNWGHFFHQRLAYLRGIENLMLDFQ